MIALMLVAGLCAPPQMRPTNAPQQGSLRVVVIDRSGGVLVGADVLVLDEDGTVRRLTTDARGEAVFAGLEPGRLTIRVAARGFEERELPNSRIRPGANRVLVRLEIARFAEHVDVRRPGRDRQLAPGGDAFATILTPLQIDSLPDDPEALEAALRQYAGPDALIRVDGFSAGRLPPKSQLWMIRIGSSFSAETHEPGVPVIEIRTKPGARGWRGSAQASLRPTALSARPALAAGGSGEHGGRAALAIDGPLRPGRTSVALSLDGRWTEEATAVVAALPSGTVRMAVERPNDRVGLSALLEHAVSTSHTARLEAQFTRDTAGKLGLGNTDLPERSYGVERNQTHLRFSDAAVWGSRLFNEFRFERRHLREIRRSATRAPTIRVLDAFTAGGAQAERIGSSWEVETADNLDLALGRHTARVGFLCNVGRYAERNEENLLGTFIFPSLAAYQAGLPTLYSRRFGDPFIEFGFWRLGWYLQDDLRFGRAVALAVGLRHELQAHVPGRANLSPRIGVTWSPAESGETVVRVGAGVGYSWLEPFVYGQTLVDGRRQWDVLVFDPGFPDPFEGGGSDALPPGRFLLGPKVAMPRARLLSASLTRRIVPGLQLTLNYTDRHTTRVFRGRDLNAPLGAAGRPRPSDGQVIQVESTGRACLRRLGASVALVLPPGPAPRLVATGSYTLSRHRNLADTPFGLPADPRNPEADWGPAGGDSRHQGAALFSVQPGHGFSLSGLLAARSGAPYNITTGYDDNADGVINDRPAGIGRNAARGAAHVELLARFGWMTGFGTRPETPAPRPSAPRARGDEGTLPDLAGVAFARFRYRLQVYVQTHNLLNRVNPVGYRGVVASPLFGTATDALPPRRVECGIRFDF